MTAMGLLLDIEIVAQVEPQAKWKVPRLLSITGYVTWKI